MVLGKLEVLHVGFVLMCTCRCAVWLAKEEKAVVAHPHTVQNKVACGSECNMSDVKQLSVLGTAIGEGRVFFIGIPGRTAATRTQKRE